QANITSQFINNPIYIIYTFAKNLAKLCLEVRKPHQQQPDRGLQKRIARDLWELLIDLYSDSIVTSNRARTNTPPPLMSNQNPSHASNKPPPLLQVPAMSGGSNQQTFNQTYDVTNTLVQAASSSAQQQQQASPANVTSPTNAQQS